MSENINPLGRHDFEHDQNLLRLSRENQRRLLRKLEEDTAIFRADVYLKMSKHGALNGGTGWAYFVPDATTYQSGNEGSVISAPARELLVAVNTVGNTEQKAIRIISNEMVAAEGRLGYITQDFSVDGGGNMQYFVDEVRMLPEPYEHSHGVLFTIDSESGELKATDNFNQLTPIICINGGKASESDLVPFGLYSCLEDRIYALDQGEQLLAEVLAHEPVFQKPTISG